MHLDGSPGLRSAKVSKPGRPAPSERMLPGCPKPRPPSCAGEGCQVGPSPTNEAPENRLGKSRQGKRER